MISICIPIYNFDVTNLVKALSTQVKELNVPSEIILIDDASKEEYRAINHSICSQEKYILLQKNIGRSAIRNLFLKHAKYDYLLFLDCDSLLLSDYFIANYVKTIIDTKSKVICGGREYPKQKPSKEKLLRWKYGIEKESKPVEERRKNPNQSFMTNNFLVFKKVLEDIQFEEKLTQYGHEDTLFGFELKKNNIDVFHINNPILNGDLEENTDYLLNTEKAISNLVHILKIKHYDNDLIEDVTLLRTYYRYKILHWIILPVFKLSKSIIKKRLIEGKVSLFLFNFYKLGTLTQIISFETNQQ